MKLPTATTEGFGIDQSLEPDQSLFSEKLPSEFEPASSAATSIPTSSDVAYSDESPNTGSSALDYDTYDDDPVEEQIPVGQNAAAGSKVMTNERSFGKSVAGLTVAAIVAGFFGLVWLVIAAVSGYELGIVAWAIGGAVGLVAGAIARNPSSVYCSLVAGVALMSVLGAKAVMLAVILAMTWGVDMLETFTPGREKLVHATADQMLTDRQFEGIEKEYVELYVSAFFSDSNDLYDDMTDEMFEVSDDVEQRIQDELGTKTPEEEEQLLEAARARHPEWIEDRNHYLAAIDKMLLDEGTLNDDLAAHARSELFAMDDSWDEEYHKSIAAVERSRRRTELRDLAAEQIHRMTLPERDQAVRDTLQRHPTWRPYPNAYIAMVEKLHHEGELNGPLAEHAQATVENRLTEEYPDYFENVSNNDQEARDQELGVIVSEKLVDLDSAGRATLIAETTSRYPDWSSELNPMGEIQGEMDAALEELGTDGTFWGSLGVVLTPMDFLWLFLSATTAFGTARRYGTETA